MFIEWGLHTDQKEIYPIKQLYQAVSLKWYKLLPEETKATKKKKNLTKTKLNPPLVEREK